MKRRLSALFLAFSLTLALAACNAPSIAALRGGVAGFSPLVQLLVSQGKISTDKAAIYTADANRIVDGFSALTTDWDAAKTKGDKAVAIGRFANTLAPITADFGRVPQLATAMAILNTTVAVIAGFYSGAPAASPNAPRDEKALDEYIKSQSAKLKVALKG